MDFLGNTRYGAWAGERVFIALIIGSVLAFIGSVYGIYRVSTSIRIQSAQRIEKPKRNTLVWIIVAIASGAGAVLTYILGMRVFNAPPVFMLILIVILASVCLFSIFVLVSNRKRKEEMGDTIPSADVEGKTSE